MLENKIKGIAPLTIPPKNNIFISYKEKLNFFLVTNLQMKPRTYTFTNLAITRITKTTMKKIYECVILSFSLFEDSHCPCQTIIPIMRKRRPSEMLLSRMKVDVDTCLLCSLML